MCHCGWRVVAGIFIIIIVIVIIIIIINVFINPL